MNLKELDPYANNYKLPITKYNTCILRQEHLGLINLPLVSKLNGCNQLLVSIDHEIEAVGPDGTSIELKPLGGLLSEKKLLAETPLTSPTRTNNWVPPRIESEQVLGYAKHMNLLVEATRKIKVNILPYPIEKLVVDKGILRIKEGGIIVSEYFHEEPLRDNKTSDLEVADNTIRYYHGGFTIVLKTTGNVEVRKIRHRMGEGLLVFSDNTRFVSIENMLYININNIVLEHDYYNMRVRYLQPLGFIEEELNKAIITSPIICIEPVTRESICFVSDNPITLELYPGKALVSSHGPIHVLFSRKMFEWNNTLNILWSRINKPVEINADVKTILWRITPYTVKPLSFRYEPISDRKIRARIVLWNSTNRSIQASIWFPAKITQAKTLDQEFREVEELIPDYDRVRTGIPPLGISIVELELLKLPPLLLKELMRRGMLSPYTPP